MGRGEGQQGCTPATVPALYCQRPTQVVLPHPAGTGPTLTMEFRLRGDPEDCVKRPATVGRARRLGDTPVLRLRVPADARFLRLRLRLSCPWLCTESPRVPEVKGLCLVEGDCLELELAAMLKTILLLASFSGSETAGSEGSSPLLVSGNGPWAVTLSRGLAESWWAGEAGPELRGCGSRGGCCGGVLREPMVAKRLPGPEDSSKTAVSIPEARGAGLLARAPLMATEPV